MRSLLLTPVSIMFKTVFGSPKRQHSCSSARLVEGVWRVYYLYKILIITLNVGKNIRKLVKDRLIMRRQTTMHSRSRAKAWAESKRKGKQINTIPVPAPLMKVDLT